jgi:hypothetical protein
MDRHDCWNTDFERAVNTIKDIAINEKEKESIRKRIDANGFKVILLTYPKVPEDSSSSHNKEDERPPKIGLKSIAT